MSVEDLIQNVTYTKYIEIVAFGEDIHPATFFNLYQQTFGLYIRYERYHDFFRAMKESVRSLMKEHPEIHSFYIMYNPRKNIGSCNSDSRDHKTPFWRNPVDRPQTETVLDDITNHVMDMIRNAHIEHNPILQAGK